MRESGGSVEISVPDVLALVERFDPSADGRALASVEQTMDLLQASPAPFSRTSYVPGHITASAVVLAPDLQHVLLVYHERLGRWLQPGGHVEPDDTTVQDTARREVLEETGIGLESTQAPALVAVDVHEIPETAVEPFHLHHDLMFHFTVAVRGTPSSHQRATWCPIADLPRFGVDGPLLRGVARALRTTPPLLD
jgi:8-oxo-dGTP pyrophosphatase MutT (NUDIX family)